MGVLFNEDRLLERVKLMLFARKKSRAFTEISKFAYASGSGARQHRRDVTDALHYSNEISPGPVLYQISRSPIAVRTC